MRFLLMVVALLVAGCVSPTPPEAGPSLPAVEERPDEPMVAPLAVQPPQGTLSGTPVAPTQAEHAFHVPAWAANLTVRVTWQGPLSALNLSVLDPRGQAVPAQAAGERALQVIIEEPRPGAWKAVVGSERAVQEAYEVKVEAGGWRPGAHNLAERLVLPPKGFAEVNFIMDGNGTVAFAWAVEPAADALFNVHSHEHGQTTMHEERTAASGNGTFTAPKPEVYSLMWENTGDVDASVELRMSGAFRMHSQTALR